MRTHETATLKVNDTEGVPIEIAMAVSWQVTDTVMALFAVEDYPTYVVSQCERALRQVVRIAYAAEIAHAMLRRQQAAAVLAAANTSSKAVGMVELVLRRLGDRHIVDLDEERKNVLISFGPQGLRRVGSLGPRRGG